MYKNTSKFLPNLVDNIIKRDNNRGYAPLYGKIENVPMSFNNDAVMKVDDQKLAYVEKLIVDAKENNIPIVFMISPSYFTDCHISEYEPAIALCDQFDVPLYIFIDYKPISENISFFQDAAHLNNDGALLYSQIVVKEILSNYFLN